jgi:hypothetical protein
VFQFLSITIACIGVLSLLLLLTAPLNQRGTVLWFAGLTIAISVGLRFVRESARHEADVAARLKDGVPVRTQNT